MDPKRKAELKRAYKEVVHPKGIFKVSCESTGQTWADYAPNLDTIQNRIWFNLRMGSHPNKKLQQAWNDAGADAIRFEVVEVFKEDVTGLALETLSKSRKQHWLTELDGAPCLK